MAQEGRELIRNKIRTSIKKHDLHFIEVNHYYEDLIDSIMESIEETYKEAFKAGQDTDYYDGDFEDNYLTYINRDGAGR